MLDTVSAYEVEANFAKALTRSTTETILNEISTARLLIKAGPGFIDCKSLGHMLKMRSMKEFVQMHRYLLCFDVYIDHQAEKLEDPKVPTILDLVEVKAEGQKQVLSALVNLEQRLKSIGHFTLRLKPKPIRLEKKIGFCWLLGANGGNKSELKNR